MPSNPIFESRSYVKASEDLELLKREELRPIRLQLELIKPELILKEQGIHSTIAVFGSARTLEPDAARERLERARDALRIAPADPELTRALTRAERGVEHARYYEMAREFARIVAPHLGVPRERRAPDPAGSLKLRTPPRP